MAFQKFGTADGKILKPEPDEAEQMQRTASKIHDQGYEAVQAQRAKLASHEGHYEDLDDEL